MQSMINNLFTHRRRQTRTRRAPEPMPRIRWY
jgi:hypothetical protein